MVTLTWLRPRRCPTSRSMCNRRSTTPIHAHGQITRHGRRPAAHPSVAGGERAGWDAAVPRSTLSSVPSSVSVAPCRSSGAVRVTPSNPGWDRRPQRERSGDAERPWRSRRSAPGVHRRGTLRSSDGAVRRARAGLNVVADVDCCCVTRRVFASIPGSQSLCCAAWVR